MITFDFQDNLLTPNLHHNDIFYVLQMWTYNFQVEKLDVGKDRGSGLVHRQTHRTWNEFSTTFDTLVGWRKSKIGDTLVNFGEQGWCSGDSTHLPPFWLGINSWTQRHMWIEFVPGSPLCSERFFSGYSGFPLSSKSNISKFQFNPDFSGWIATLWRCHFKIPLLFIIIIIIIIIIITTK